MSDGDGGDQALNLVEKALQITRERILTGEYAPGSRLRLSQLADQTGVSLIPVREALRVLETERLVRNVPNKGATVTELSITDMNDLYATRKLLEGEAVASCRPLTADEALDLEQLLVELECAQEAGDRSKAMRLHRDFHFALYERTESSWLPFVIDILWKHAERYQWRSLSHGRDVANDEHRLILSALVEGDSEAAAGIMSKHLERTRAIIGKAYGDSPEFKLAPS